MPILPKRVVLELEQYPAPEEGRYAFVRLDFNENTTGYPKAYPQDMPAITVSAYPEYANLTQKIADLYKLDPSWLMLTNGSDDGISIVAQTFIEPGEDSAVVSKPCFVVILQSLKLAGAKMMEVPLTKELSFDIEGIEKALKQSPKIAMFASPDNPTGSLLDAQIIRRWCTEYPKTLFAIDEAYGEFADSSMVEHVKQIDNLVVLRTFSKAWGMAGLRLGIVFGNPKLVEYMNVVRLPYTVNSAAVWTASQLLDRSQEVLAGAKATLKEKERMVEQLQHRGFKMHVGHGNSVLLQAGFNAQPLTEFCRRRGVLVRNRSNVRFPDDLNGKRDLTWGLVRISVGSPGETEKLVSAIDEFHKRYGLIFDLDGTLIDVSNSYDQTVAQLFEKHAGKPLDMKQLQSLRAEGGFNDDWVATVELLKRSGVRITLEDITAEAVPLYMSIASKSERLFCELSVLERLAARHPLFVVTGRTRREYEQVWGERLGKVFQGVYCIGDLPGKQPKPSPDYLHHVLETHSLKGGAYVGNAVDDMQAARAAGLDAIGITTTQPATVLGQAGSHLCLPSVASLAEVLMV
jgi:histidinol-phosphate aminotransferase